MGKQIWPCCKKVKRQHRTIILAILGRSPVSHNLCKDQGPGLIWFWRRRVLKVFTIYGHGSHFDQWTTPILAIFRSPAPRRLQFEQHWPRGFRGEIFWNYQYFVHTNVWGPYKCIQKWTWSCRKKVKHQCTTIILATLVDLPSLMICAKIQPQGTLSSGEEDF